MKNLLLILVATVLATFTSTSCLFSQPKPSSTGMTSEADRNIGIVRGKLLDSQTGGPVEYGNIAFFRIQDSVMVGGTISLGDGSFVFEKFPLGKYFAKVQFIGYDNLIINDISVTMKAPAMDLGEIRLVSKASALTGVEVMAERTTMSANLDKRVINVEKDLTSVGGTAIDIMQNIPSVTVDVEGNVKLRGSSNVLILIDGKPTGLEGVNSSDILQQLPANSIESVELITNPSVRYDPDGTTGIINIVLKKKTFEGVSGMTSLNTALGGRYNGNLNLSLRSQKLTLTAGLDGRINTFNGSSETLRNITFNDITTRLTQNGSNTNSMHMLNGSLGVDYTMNKYNSLTMQFRARSFSEATNSLLLNQTFGAGSALIRDFTRDSESDRAMRSFNYTLGYKRTTKTKGEELTADLMFSDNAMKMTQASNQINIYPFASWLTQLTANDNTNRMLVSQLNYVRPLGQNMRLEAGYKSDIRFLTMNNSYSWVNPLSGQPLAPTESRFAYDEQIHALYGIVSGQKEKFRYQAGMRAEYAQVNGNEEVSATSFNKRYTSLYPSLHLVYSMSPTSDIQLSYSRRVSRPQNRFLNPYIDYSDSINIRSGNPELKPEYSGSYDLSFVTYKERNSLTASVFYRKTSDVIQNISGIYSANITWTTPQNLTTSSSYGVELILSREITKWFRLNANASYFRQTVKEVPEFSIPRTDNYTWNTRLSAQIATSKTSSLQLSGSYSAPTIMAQGRMDAQYFADAAWKIDLMDRKASVSVRLSDIFNSRRFQSQSWGPGFDSSSLRKMDSRIFWVGLSYKFNNYQQRQANKRNADTGIENTEDF